MFVVLLKFAHNRAEASRHMAGHKIWLERGFTDGKFLLSGGIEPRSGGAILAHGVSRDEIEKIVAQDPFVTADVVSAEIVEITPSQADQRLQFLLS